MDMIFALFENNLTAKQAFKSKLQDILSSYQFKRTVLHILWAIFNLPLLVYGTNLMLNLDLVFVWIGIVIMYMPCYWILSSILFDNIIGDDIDNDSIF